ncbi:MAG: response regulator, partial [candidate division WOR-3 bacterium]
MIKKIYILDDNYTFTKSMEKFLIDKNFDAKGFTNENEFINFISKEKPDVILLDIKLKEKDGLIILDEIREKFEDVYIIIVTAYGSIENAVKAIKKGAYYYLSKPFDPEEVLILIEKIEEEIKNKEVLKAISGEEIEIIGKNEKFLKALELAKKVAGEDVAVLLTGESGTG